MKFHTLKEVGILDICQCYMIKDSETNEQIDWAYGDEEVVKIDVDRESFIPIFYLKGKKRRTTSI